MRLGRFHFDIAFADVAVCENRDSALVEFENKLTMNR